MVAMFVSISFEETSFGIIVRLSDKIARLQNLVQNEGKPKVDESIEDTLEDIAGYAINYLRLKKENKIK